MKRGRGGRGGNSPKRTRGEDDREGRQGRDDERGGHPRMDEDRGGHQRMDEDRGAGSSHSGGSDEGRGQRSREASSSRGSERGDDNGRGGGGRSGRGGRGGRGGRPRQTFEERRQERLDQHDLVVSRVVNAAGEKAKKMGSSGQPVNLLSNYFVLEKRTDWAIYHYRVDFKPDERDTRTKKKLFRDQQNEIGAYIFDGSSLYLSHRLTPEPKILCSQGAGGELVEMTVRLVAELAPTDVMYLQIYNIFVRKCLDAMDLEELGRHYYDRHAAIRIDAHRLELWPGYITSMRNHEKNVLLGVEITHKVLRMDNCLRVIESKRNAHDFREAVKHELVGAVVLTHYNRKTYRVDDIDWEQHPTSTFDLKDQAKQLLLPTTSKNTIFAAPTTDNLC